MQGTSRPLVIAFSLLVCSLFLSAPSIGVAQTQMPTYPTRPAPAIPGLPTSVLPATTPTPMPSLPESLNASGGGFSDYVNGLPTKLTLPDGTVVDLSIPENTLPESLSKISTLPKVPKAFETVTVRIENYSTKLEEDRIIWTVNGCSVQARI